jgi:uncharacterized protein (DUF1697 family)
VTTFIALLRGINVGGNRKVPMADLRALCDAAGFTDVKSYIQSGNLVFASKGTDQATEKKLEAAIEERFGFAVEVIVRSAKEWATYAKGNPFRDESKTDGKHVVLLLSKAKPKADAAATLGPRALAGEVIESVGDALWIYYPKGIGDSKLTPALLDRAVGSTVTARNWQTVTELAKLAAAST